MTTDERLASLDEHLSKSIQLLEARVSELEAAAQSGQGVGMSGDWIIEWFDEVADMLHYVAEFGIAGISGDAEGLSARSDAVRAAITADQRAHYPVGSGFEAWWEAQGLRLGPGKSTAEAVWRAAHAAGTKETMDSFPPAVALSHLRAEGQGIFCGDNAARRWTDNPASATCLDCHRAYGIWMKADRDNAMASIDFGGGNRLPRSAPNAVEPTPKWLDDLRAKQRPYICGEWPKSDGGTMPDFDEGDNGMSACTLPLKHEGDCRPRYFDARVSAPGYDTSMVPGGSDRRDEVYGERGVHSGPELEGLRRPRRPGHYYVLMARGAGPASDFIELEDHEGRGCRGSWLLENDAEGEAIWLLEIPVVGLREAAVLEKAAEEDASMGGSLETIEMDPALVKPDGAVLTTAQAARVLKVLLFELRAVLRGENIHLPYDAVAEVLETVVKAVSLLCAAELEPEPEHPLQAGARMATTAQKRMIYALLKERSLDYARDGDINVEDLTVAAASMLIQLGSERRAATGMGFRA